MSRVLSSSRSGKKSDWLSGRLLPISKMEFIQEMLSSERKQVLEWEDSLSSPSSSSVASGSYFLFHILQLNCKTNDPETHFNYVRAFIHLFRKHLSAYLKHPFEVFLNFNWRMIVSVTHEIFVNAICVIIFQIEADIGFPKSFLAKRITRKARTIFWTSNSNQRLKNLLRINFILAKCSCCGQSEIKDVVTQEFSLSNSGHPQFRIIMIIIRLVKCWRYWVGSFDSSSSFIAHCLQTTSHT